MKLNLPLFLATIVATAPGACGQKRLRALERSRVMSIAMISPSQGDTSGSGTALDITGPSSKAGKAGTSGITGPKPSSKAGKAGGSGWASSKSSKSEWAGWEGTSTPSTKSAKATAGGASSKSSKSEWVGWGGTSTSSAEPTKASELTGWVTGGSAKSAKSSEWGGWSEGIASKSAKSTESSGWSSGSSKGGKAIDKLVNNLTNEIDELKESEKDFLEEIDELKESDKELMNEIDELKESEKDFLEEIDELKERFETLETLQNQANIHPSGESCADDEERIAELARGLPNGCSIQPVPVAANLASKYILVCTKSGEYNLHLPDMCNAKALFVGGGGAGGAPGRDLNDWNNYGVYNQAFSGGGGGGAVEFINNTSFGDGYYYVSVGAGGVSALFENYVPGAGGDTHFDFKVKKSLFDSDYKVGQYTRALGGGHGGGIILGQSKDYGECNYPSSGGSGGGGIPARPTNSFGYCRTSGGLSFGTGANVGGSGNEKNEPPCSGGGGGAGERGDDGTTGLDNNGKACEQDQGGDGLCFIDEFGDYYGAGGCFGGGGNPAFSIMERSLGGGGSRGVEFKDGYPGSGGGGLGCNGYNLPEYVGTDEEIWQKITDDILESCHTIQTAYPWSVTGGKGGDGIVMIVFDECLCNEDST